MLSVVTAAGPDSAPLIWCHESTYGCFVLLSSTLIKQPDLVSATKVLTTQRVGESQSLGHSLRKDPQESPKLHPQAENSLGVPLPLLSTGNTCSNGESTSLLALLIHEESDQKKGGSSFTSLFSFPFLNFLVQSLYKGGSEAGTTLGTNLDLRREE